MRDGLIRRGTQQGLFPVKRHEFVAIAPTQRLERRWINRRNWNLQGPQLRENLCALSGCEDIKGSPRRVAAILPRMHGSPRDEDPGARTTLCNLLAELEGERSRQDVDHFIAGVVNM